MKNRFNFVVLMLAAMLTLAVGDASAQKRDSSQDEIDLSELTLSETLMLPDVPQKQTHYIKDYMKREAQFLKKAGYDVELMRNGEVVVTTIPASELFGPNETELLPSAPDKLKVFLPYFRTSGMFKVILAMHSDNTGSPDYLYSLTEGRILSLYDYFDHYASQTDLLQGYPMSDSDPRAGITNNSMKNRQANRRLEIFIVPGPELIASAINHR